MKISEDDEKAAHIADIVKALSHPARLRIVAILCEEDETVSRLADRIGLPQAAVSQQLKILRLSGLVESSREDGFAVYRLAEPRLKSLIQCLDGCQAKESGGSA
jgi:DNA-binding transcriptional ArsR family regulator